MKNLKRFNSKPLLFSYLIHTKGAQSHNLEQGFEQFRLNVLEKQKNIPTETETFHWLTSTGEPIVYAIGIQKEEDTESYYIEEDIPVLVGLKEFAEVLQWDKARLSIKFARQRSGKKVRPPLPEPIQILASTPVWTLKQALDYKELVENKEVSLDEERP